MTLHNNDKDPCTMARKRPSLSNQKAGLDTVTVMNVHFQPDFAKQGHRALVVLIAILLICRSHQCLMMAGDLSAACYRIYNPKRKDHQMGAQPDPNNCTVAVAIKILKNATRITVRNT